MSSFAQTLQFTYNEGAIFIGINNAVKAASRKAVAFLADRFGCLKMLVICRFLSPVTVMTLLLISTRDTFISFVVLYEIVSGPIVSLLPTCIIELFGVQNYQSSSGLLYFAADWVLFSVHPLQACSLNTRDRLPLIIGMQPSVIAAFFFTKFLCFLYVTIIVASDKGNSPNEV